MTEETPLEIPKRRPGRPRRPISPVNDPIETLRDNQVIDRIVPTDRDFAGQSEPESERAVEPKWSVDEITYIPGDQDPVNTMLGFDPARPGSGHKFHANLPVKFKRSQTIKQLIVKKSVTREGNTVTQAIEQDTPVVDVVRDNPRFSINGRLPTKQQTTTVRFDPDWYRGYAHKWITLSTKLSTMNENWDREAQLRADCGCGPEEIEYLETVLEYMRKRLTVDI